MLPSLFFPQTGIYSLVHMLDLGPFGHLTAELGDKGSLGILVGSGQAIPTVKV